MKHFNQFFLAAVLLLPFISAQEEGGWKSTDGYSLPEIRALTGTSNSGDGTIDLEAAPFAARSLSAEPATDVSLTQKSFAIAPVPIVAGNSSDQITPEIQALARGLQYDPLNIFHFVKNRVDYECYYGSKKGAHLTLMEMGGNDYDQSSLLVALLRASGYPATYVAAPVSFTYQYLSSATGVENPFAHLSDAEFAAEISTVEDPVLETDPELANLRKQYGISGFFLNRGWPVVDAGAGASVFTLSHVWVRCTVDGEQVNISPSIKAYTRDPGISVVPAGMSKAAILAATAGSVDAVNGKKWVKNLQYGALETLLSTYTNQVIAELKSNHDGESMDDLLGAPKIVPVVYPDLASAIQITAAPAGWASFEIWAGSAIPTERMSKIEFTGGDVTQGGAIGASGSKPLYQRSYTMAELAGRKLSLTFTGSNSRTATFSLDDVTDSSFTMSGIMFHVRSKVIHPHFSLRRNQNGEYEKVGEQRHNSSVITSYNNRINSIIYPGNTIPSCYAIVSGFENPRKLLRKRQEVLEKLRKTYPDTDNRVRTEILNVLGLDWYDQTWRHSHFAASQQQTLPLFHHRIGTVAQEANYFIDIPQQLYSVAHRGANASIARKFLGIESLVHSAMEHAVVDQSVGQPVAVSTVEMIWRANQAGEEIYRMQSDTWDAEKGSLIGYVAADTAFLEAVFDLAGTIGLMPKTGNRLVNGWRGAGYAAITASDFHFLKISGGLNGGFASVGGYIGSNPLMQHLWSDPAYNATPSNVVSAPITPHTTPRQISWDPVDMLSGAFLLDETDLNLGRLSFSRHYNSHQRNNDLAGLGNGWTHGHDIRLTERSSTLAALGETNTYQAAAVYVGSLAANMVYDNGSAKDWAVAALVSRWTASMTFNNAVGITFGNKTVEFIKMPGGTFVAPPGMSYTLTKTGGSPATATTPAVLGIYTLTERNGSAFLFNANGRISRITDPNGNTQTFNYNGSGQLTTVVDSFGHTFTYGWSAGKIGTVSDGTGRTVTLGYTAGNLTTVKDVEDKTRSYQYDIENRMESQKNARSEFTIINHYDSGNRVVLQESMGRAANRWHYGWSGFLNLEQNPAGNITGYHYDRKGRSLGITDPLGNSTAMTYDGEDRVISNADAKGAETVNTWNNDHTLATETDPDLQVTQFFYDGFKRLQKITDKRGHDTDLTWTGQHQLGTTTDQLGHVITNTYYATGKLKTIKDAEDRLTTFEYQPDGFLKKTIYSDQKTLTLTVSNRGETLTSTDAENRVTTNTYNKRSQIRTVTLPPIPGEPPAVVTYVYDDLGNLQSVTDPKLNLTSNTYNALSNPFTTTLPAITTSPGVTQANVLTTEYDARDWTKWVVNSANHKITTEHDGAKRITAVIDPLTRRTETLYDPNGRPTETKDPLQRITKQVYNERGEQETATDGMARDTGFLYDANGSLTHRTNRRGKTTVTIFDDANRPTTLTTPGNKATITGYYDNNLVHTVKEPSNQTTTFLYNSRNLVESKADGTGTVSYTYDGSTLPRTATEGGVTITRTYDERGRLKTFTTADGDLIQYRYDANGNLTRLTYPDATPANSTDDKHVHYTYNARNQLETVTDWNNKTTRYHYDRLGRLTGTTRPNGTVNVISHDNAGQIGTIKETSHGKAISYLTFKHDVAGQIVSRLRAPLPAPSWSHPTFSAAYDDDNRLIGVGGQSVTHDDDGNMTNGPIRADSGFKTLGYNTRNQLTSADGLTYTYDAEGNRRTMAGPEGATRFVIDTNARLSRLLVRHGPGNTRTRYVYGLGLLYEVDDAEQTKTHHYDQSGSTILRTNDTGEVIGTAEYSAYGLIAFKQGDLDTPFLYNGRQGVYTDPNGLLNMRARYYSPYLMRFLNPDPTGFSGGSNWFAYADGNPISLSDPFGLCAERNLCTGGYGYGNAYASGEVAKLNAVTKIGVGFTPYGLLLDVGDVMDSYSQGSLGGMALAGLGFLPGGDFLKVGKYADEIADVTRIRQTTVLGENMRDRVIPFAEATNARNLPWGTTPQQWADMTPQQRWRLNDGTLRARINEGDTFRYIGIDAGRPAAERLRFDLTRSELLRLNDRGIPYQTVTPQEVLSTIGRQ